VPACAVRSGAAERTRPRARSSGSLPGDAPSLLARAARLLNPEQQRPYWRVRGDVTGACPGTGPLVTGTTSLAPGQPAELFGPGSVVVTVDHPVVGVAAVLCTRCRER
jgi:hypothetical protein